VSGRVLLVIDMLADFLEPSGGLYCGAEAEKIVPFVRGKIDEVIADGGSVIFICDAHEPDDIEFRRFPAHCVKGSGGAEVVEPLRIPNAGGARVFNVYKARYSGFYGTRLEDILKELDPAEVEVTGVCTNICVLYTVEELCNRDYAVKVYREGVASFDPGAAAWALDQMEKVLGARVV